jgi:hypothetical protein
MPPPALFAPDIPQSEHLRERLDAVETEANLLRAQLRLALRRDREMERLRQDNRLECYSGE